MIKKKPRVRSFSEIWGKDLAKHGISGCPILVSRYMHETGVSPTEQSIVFQVLSFKWTKKDPYPSSKTIAKQIGISRQTVQNSVASLKKKKLLLRKDRKWDFSPLFAKCLVIHQSKEKQPLDQPLTSVRTELLKNLKSCERPHYKFRCKGSLTPPVKVA